MITASAGVQICQKWFTPHVDLFATYLNHKISLYVSLVPDQHRCSEYKLVGSHCLCLPSHGSPSQGDPKNRAMQKDLTWSDSNNNMYLGSVVAAQKVLEPSPQTSHPWKENKGGGTSAAAKSSGV